jgi:hypothetical protein
VDPDARGLGSGCAQTTVGNVPDAPFATPGPAARPGRQTGSRRRWWRDEQRRNRVALVTFAVVAVGSILYAAVVTQLLPGDNRVLVVTMAQDADQSDREALKAACGALPSVSVVADRGNPDPRVQGRFPVRFRIRGASVSEEAALTDCINRQEGVRGFLVERD